MQPVKHLSDSDTPASEGKARSPMAGDAQQQKNKRRENNRKAAARLRDRKRARINLLSHALSVSMTAVQTLQSGQEKLPEQLKRQFIDVITSVNNEIEQIELHTKKRLRIDQSTDESEDEAVVLPNAQQQKKTKQKNKRMRTTAPRPQTKPQLDIQTQPQPKLDTAQHKLIQLCNVAERNNPIVVVTEAEKKSDYSPPAIATSANLASPASTQPENLTRWQPSQLPQQHQHYYTPIMVQNCSAALPSTSYTRPHEIMMPVQQGLYATRPTVTSESHTSQFQGNNKIIIAYSQ
eukprot:m.335948 g.335948  ORF g.335948 m.335948 type:complete len:292 (-) comp17719_c0_seq1:94-969(-)